MSNQQGFTLMEALVAVAVFATAAMGLISLNTNSVRISGQMGERVLARQVAENVAVDTVTDPQFQVIGLISGEDIQRRRAFIWEREISPAPREDLIQITIRVRAKDDQAVLSEITVLHRLKGNE